MFYSTLYAFAVSALVLQVCLFNCNFYDDIFLEYYIIWSKPSWASWPARYHRTRAKKIKRIRSSFFIFIIIHLLFMPMLLSILMLPWWYTAAVFPLQLPTYLFMMCVFCILEYIICIVLYIINRYIYI